MEHRPSLLDEYERKNSKFYEEKTEFRQFSQSEETQAAMEEDIKLWDMFRVLPLESDNEAAKREERIEKALKVVKVIAVIFVFVLVLGGTVIAKGTMLFMTSQLRRDHFVEYCNKELDINQEKQFVSKLNEEDRVVWIWFIFLSLCVPEVLAFLRSLRINYFKYNRRPNTFDMLFTVSMETCGAIGTAMLCFSILPDLDVVKGVMLTNCVCFIPSLLGLLCEDIKEQKEKVAKRAIVLVIIDILAISAQVTGFVVWPLVEPDKKSLWLIPLSIFLISLSWWENYVTANSSFGFIRRLGQVKNNIKKSRYSIWLYLSIWKILVLFSMMILFWTLRNGDPNDLFKLLPKGFQEHKISVFEVRSQQTTVPSTLDPQPEESIYTVSVDLYAPVWVFVIQICSAYVAYVVGKYACRIMVQGFSYAFPVTITVPLTISILIILCSIRNEDPCAYSSSIPNYLFFTSPPIYHLYEYIYQHHVWIWLVWLSSQIWITSHIWWPKCERLSATEKLFVTPMYNGFLIDQSLSLNRRIDDGDENEKPKQKEEIQQVEKEKEKEVNYYDAMSFHSDTTSIDGESGTSSTTPDNVTRIFACATMWHETKEEMMEILKSIFRMDEDQSARRVAQTYLRLNRDPDYYEFETHIFFDDAYELSGPPTFESKINIYVKQLINSIDDAASRVHETHVRLRPPKKYPTPYGGRLVWTLPGKTKLYVHLKDKNKIRHKKRWSQVMYMYYLLGFRLMELPMPAERKEVIAENTYLLALDGDIDFQPSSVQLLVDLMKKNRQLGAACGRIHPIGSGTMVWYQKFEYAIGHWLQKATEHTIGCVLCSPGCFSLFRGKALMDDNVMRKYTFRSEEAKHYVQYDQGEDRWLCTLLLQRGYRVEYSAASDAFTHSPEGFNEFYNQRRRWVPSTMANIIDLLGDFKRTVKVNDNISGPYIVYQAILLGGSVLGPGTILLMLIGAFIAAFGMDQWTSFLYNIIPVFIFMVVCYFAQSKTQLKFAFVISAIYGMVMIAVLIGIMMQINEDGVLAPSSLFFFIVTGQMVIAALLHPLEVGCLPFGVIYYVTVPSMYMLLIIYSLFNMNNVSWGTREGMVQKTKAELDKEAEEAKKHKKEGTVMGFFNSFRSEKKSKHEDEGSIEFSIGGLFKIMCCAYPKQIDEKQQLLRIAETLDVLNRRMETMEKSFDPRNALPLGSRRRSFSILRNANDKLESLKEEPTTEEIADEVGEESSEDDSVPEEPKQEKDVFIGPYWMEDEDLRKAETEFIETFEVQFWKDLIDKYLYPLDKNENEQNRITKDLKRLRDKSVFGFFMLNSMFVMTLFLVQLNKDVLHINWPLGVKTTITFDYNTEEIMLANEYLELDPIGMLFLVSFASILFIQFIAMLFHRFGTLSHILASTEIGWYCTKNVEDLSSDAIMDKYAVAIAKELQRLRDLEAEDERLDGQHNSSLSDSSDAGRRPRFTIPNLERVHQRRKYADSLANAFERRITRLSTVKNIDELDVSPAIRRLTQRRDTMLLIQQRRNSVMAERRNTIRGSVASHVSEEPEENNEINISNHSTPVLRRKHDSVVKFK